ncbi:MAG: ATP-dependent metallopeptidase FtsH/Yme1/Tma family protein, partial [Treponema sp.]|nr:ATP-dependent metallopeptidase FtsH/Yme1/Tma family protein [Treponema sp.]
MSDPAGLPDPAENGPEENSPPPSPFGRKPQRPKKFGGWKFTVIYLILFLALMGAFNYYMASKSTAVIDFSEFKNKIASGEIKRVEMSESVFTGYITESKPVENQSSLPFSLPFGRSAQTEETVYRTIPLNDPDIIKLMDEQKIAYYAVSRQGGAIINLILSWVLPIVFFIIVWRFLMKRSGLGGNVLSVGQNKAVIVAEGDIITRFKDVAGVDEAKEELVEVVDFLKSPTKYTDIGGKIP